MTDASASELSDLTRQTGYLRDQLAALAARAPVPLPTTQELAVTAERIHAARPGIPAHHAFAVLQALRAIRALDRAPGPDREDRIPLDQLTTEDLDLLYDVLDRYAEVVGELNETSTGLAQRAEQAEAERDGAYRERAHLVALLAAMTDGAVIAPAADVAEPGWQIVYLTLGGQQASWHIAPRDADLFAHVERVDATDPRAHWDGHTTDAKYAAIAAWTADLAQSCGPACSEMHTETGRCEIARNR